MESTAVPLFVSVEDYLRQEVDAIDRREKLLNYPQISTFEEYVLIAQDAREVTVHRRTEDWRPLLFAGPEALVEFRSIQLTLPLARIYEGAL